VSNLGRWAPWYDQLEPGASPEPYGATPTYEMGAQWLADWAMTPVARLPAEPVLPLDPVGFLIEDWGCGKGWMRTLIPAECYRGIDGTKSPFADVVADLATYRAEDDVLAIFMRGVLEHNYGWRKIIANAMNGFRYRMALVLFTPMTKPGAGTTEIGFTKELGVPDLSLDHLELMPFLEDRCSHISWRDVDSPDTGYGTERVYFLEK
jgi:hypothetical protein